MNTHRLAVLGILCAVVTKAYASWTSQNLIVTKPDNMNNDELTSTPAVPIAEVPLSPIKTMEMHVRADVTLRYSRTSVITAVRNPAKRSQETTFRVLLSETAFITGFTMTLEGKKYVAYVKEKEEAQQIYNEAVSQGVAAAHVATKARDSNHFIVTMNIKENSTASFNLTYEELLSRRNGVYNLALNLLAETVVPRLTVTVHIKESQKISILRVPEISTGNEIIPTENYAENQKAKVTRSPNGKEVTVVFEPDLAEQNRLREVYAQNTKKSLQNTNTLGSHASNKEGATEVALGQFVVQYDVDRTKVVNEVLVNDGYFVHFFAPSDLPPLNKYVIFVLDLSEIMAGQKIEQLRDAMRTILTELNEGDYFSLVLFRSSVKVQDLNDNVPQPVYYKYEQPEVLPDLLPPYPVTPENIAKAKNIVSKLDARSGRNIVGALNIAVTLVHRGIPNNSAYKELSNNETSGDVDHEININNDPKPVIVLLAGGEPTDGETDPASIVNIVTKKNYGERRASIFSLGFGNYADLDFLRKLSLRNNGFSRHIYEGADAALQLRSFYKQIASPLLSHVKFAYPPDQVPQEFLTKKTFHIFYAGSELIVAGKLAVTRIQPTVSGYSGTGLNRMLYENNPVVKMNHTKEKNKEDFPLERLWAYLTIKQLLDEYDTAKELDNPNKKQSASKKKALKLALQYSFVTKLTSLVVVKPNATDTVNAESSDKGPIFGEELANRPRFPDHPGLPGQPGLPAQPDFSGQPGVSSQQGFSAQHVSFQEPIADTAYSHIFSKDINLPEQYHSHYFPWMLPLLNSSSDELVIRVNGSAVCLRLTKDVDEPQRLGEAPCSNAIYGGVGSCVYPTRCEAAQNITVDIYTSTYCLLDKYAGVCCPKDKISRFHF